MPCNATSQLTNAPSVPLQVTMPTNNAQWAVFVQRLQDAINATRDAANRTGVNVVPTAYAVYNGTSLPALSINGANAALDGTKSQFGKASLKLTATAATVTVSFTGNPIAINAYQRWIESVYIQSSRASIAGTLAVVTPVASYPVDISGTLLPATWGRLYGDCSLVADASTQATLTLTLTGCSVGDTFNLEGWQLEQAAGNTNLPSAFVNSAAPGSQDTLPDGSSFVRLAGSHASGNVAYNYRGVWSSATAYVTGDEVVYSGSYWLCLTGNTNSAPAQGNGNWQVVGAYNNYQGAWSAAATYYAGQEATYNGNYWVATATNTNSAPSTSNANWVIAGPTNLDKVADGAARFAVVNAAGMKGVSSVDANNRAGIDFTQSVHVGKSLANIPDDAGTTRYAVSNIDVNRRALVDATQAGHVGAWNLDSRVADGTTYLRSAQQSGSSGSVTIENANFQLSTLAAWSGNGATAYFQSTSPAPALGSQYVVVHSTSANGSFSTVRKYACNPGDKVSVGGQIYNNGGGPANIAAFFYNASGGFVGSIGAGTAASAWTSVAASGVVPATAAYFQLGIYNVTANGFSSCNYIWASINDVRVAGSGAQLGDQRNVPPIATANLRSTWTGQTISYSATAGSPATATISVTASTLLIGGASIAYNAMSVGVSGTGGNTVTYYLYFDDPGYAGGAQTLVATTTGSTIYGANGRVYVGSVAVTFPTSGSGSGGGSGGGGACVALGAYGPQGRFDRETRCADTPDGAVSVRNLKTSPQKCVRVEYDNGTVLTCSEDAPLMGGQRKVLAIHALGEILDTSDGQSRVCSVESAGVLEVVSIDAGDVAYYASDNPDGPFALHHNKIIP